MPVAKIQEDHCSQQIGRGAGVTSWQRTNRPWQRCSLPPSRWRSPPKRLSREVTSPRSTPKGGWFDSQSGHVTVVPTAARAWSGRVPEATDQCFSFASMFLSLSSTLSLRLSKHITGWRFFLKVIFTNINEQKWLPKKWKTHGRRQRSNCFQFTGYRLYKNFYLTLDLSKECPSQNWIVVARFAAWNALCF